jgi:hypothetical protein
VTVTAALRFPTVGPGLEDEGILITSGTGAGQLRQIASTSGTMLTVATPWSTIPSPGDSLVLLNGSPGLAETSYRPAPNYHGVPGNDVLITFGSWDQSDRGFLASRFFHWRTIVHELGHNLGLRHCGKNKNKSLCDGVPPDVYDYRSLMSYAHQNYLQSTVNSYSGVGDPTFNDWFNLRLDFNRALVHLGNTLFLGLGSGAALPPGTILTDDDIPDNDPGQRQAEQLNGPLDFQSPTLDITSPSYGASFLQGQNLPVVFTATDNVALAPGSVNVRFDVDGSGAIDQTGETLVGSPTGNPNQFTVTFANLAGPNGVREIDARASDAPMGNVGQDTQPIFVPEPGVTLMMLFAVPLLGLLRRRRHRRCRYG